MANLYQMNEQMEELLTKMVDAETGEVNEEILAEVEQLECEMDTKIEQCGLYIKNRTAFVDSLTTEINALKKRRETEMNRIERTCEYVNSILKGKVKEFPKVAFKYRASRSVNIVNEDLVPDELCNFKTTRSPAKTEIAKLLKAGKSVPGCVLDIKNNLRVE